MRRINQLLVCAMAIVGCIGVGSCSGNSGNNNSVDIKMLSGSPIRETVSEKQNKVNGLLDVSSEDGESNEVRYVVMYKTEIDVEFKITVDNPQSLSIHSLQIICDDPNAKIQITTDNTTNWSLLTKEPAIAWNSSSLSQTTYKLQIPSEESLSTVNVSWLKYYDAGNTLQTNSSPTNNELPIYKMATEDLEWNFIHNTSNEYKWKFTISDKVEIRHVFTTINGVKTEINKDSEGNYKITSNGTVSYEYRYTYGEVPYDWTNVKEIELAVVSIINANANGVGLPSEIFINPLLSGTDVEINFFYVDSIYKFTWEALEDGRNDAYWCQNFYTSSACIGTAVIGGYSYRIQFA